MSGFGTVVPLPPTPPAGVEAAVAEAMAPFVIDEITGLGEWDHYWIDGDLIYQARFDGNPALIRTPGQTPLRCAGGPKRLLDIVAMRAAAAAEARAEWLGPKAYVDTADVSDLRTFLKIRASQALTATTMITLTGRWIDERTEGDYSSSSFRRQAAELAALDNDALIIHLACHG